MDKKLGLGCMRLPLTNPDDVSSINIGELSRMVDLLIENGFTYFDTAYTYHDGHCEAALRKALVERYPRNAYSLTDKLPTLLLEARSNRSASSPSNSNAAEWSISTAIWCIAPLRHSTKRRSVSAVSNSQSAKSAKG